MSATPLEPIAVFDRLVADVVSAATEADRRRLVDAFVERWARSPLLGGDEAIILFVGVARSVELRGDMLAERTEPLQRLADTSLWYYRGRYEPDARLDYHLLVDGDDLGDPRNPLVAPSGYGPRAELRMPAYDAPEPWRAHDGVPRGTTEAFERFASRCYTSTRTVWVYTPAAYDPQRRYPSIYFHDGGDYLRFAHTATILDNLIAAGSLPPCIAVFVDPSVEHGRVVEYDRSDLYSHFVCDELVPWIDERYPTIADPEQRVIAGASFGGLISLYIAQQRPDLFRNVVSQSGFVGRNDDAVFAPYDRAAPLPIAIDLIVGTYETQIGPLDRGVEADFLAGNRRFRDLLAARGYRFGYAEFHEGHAWGLWRARIGESIGFLLAKP